MKQFLTFTVLVASLLAHSQTKDGVLAGRIKGTVTDQNGSPVPGETFGLQRYRLDGALPNLLRSSRVEESWLYQCPHSHLQLLRKPPSRVAVRIQCASCAGLTGYHRQ